MVSSSAPPPGVCRAAGDTECACGHCAQERAWSNKFEVFREGLRVAVVDLGAPYSQLTSHAYDAGPFPKLHYVHAGRCRVVSSQSSYEGWRRLVYSRRVTAVLHVDVPTYSAGAEGGDERRPGAVDVAGGRGGADGVPLRLPAMVCLDLASPGDFIPGAGMPTSPASLMVSDATPPHAALPAPAVLGSPVSAASVTVSESESFGDVGHARGAGSAAPPLALEGVFSTDEHPPPVCPHDSCWTCMRNGGYTELATADAALCNEKNALQTRLAAAPKASSAEQWPVLDGAPEAYVVGAGGLRRDVVQHPATRDTDDWQATWRAWRDWLDVNPKAPPLPGAPRAVQQSSGGDAWETAACAEDHVPEDHVPMPLPQRQERSPRAGKSPTAALMERCDREHLTGYTHLQSFGSVLRGFGAGSPAPSSGSDAGDEDDPAHTAETSPSNYSTARASLPQSVSVSPVGGAIGAPARDVWSFAAGPPSYTRAAPQVAQQRGEDVLEVEDVDASPEATAPAPPPAFGRPHPPPPSDVRPRPPPQTPPSHASGRPRPADTTPHTAPAGVAPRPPPTHTPPSGRARRVLSHVVADECMTTAVGGPGGRRGTAPPAVAAPAVLPRVARRSLPDVRPSGEAAEGGVSAVPRKRHALAKASLLDAIAEGTARREGDVCVEGKWVDLVAARKECLRLAEDKGALLAEVRALTELCRSLQDDKAAPPPTPPARDLSPTLTGPSSPAPAPPTPDLPARRLHFPEEHPEVEQAAQEPPPPPPPPPFAVNVLVEHTRRLETADLLNSDLYVRLETGDGAVLDTKTKYMTVRPSWREVFLVHSPVLRVQVRARGFRARQHDTVLGSGAVQLDTLHPGDTHARIVDVDLTVDGRCVGVLCLRVYAPGGAFPPPLPPAAIDDEKDAFLSALAPLQPHMARDLSGRDAAVMAR